MFYERRGIKGEIKDLDTKNRRVSGYLSNFGNSDRHDDIIEKGAFKKSISERKEDIYFLNQHNWAQPHGRFNELTEDSKGLFFVSEPLTDTTYSSDLLKLYEAGIINQHSIGFQTIKSHTSGDHRVLTELKLFEGSNVTMGANPETPFTGFKGFTREEINDQTKRILKAFRTGSFTDETFTLLEVALKQLQEEAFNLGRKSLKTAEPAPATLYGFEPVEIIKQLNKELNF